MKLQSIAALLALLLSACVSNPSITEIQAAKPDVFKEQLNPVPDYCPPLPPPQVNINGTTFYKEWSATDKSNSIIIPERRAQNSAAVKPVEDFSQRLRGLTSAYGKNPKDIRARNCMLTFIDHWAAGDALLGSMTDTTNNTVMPMGVGYRDFVLSNTAAVYLRVRQFASPEQDARIKWWMTQVAQKVVTFFDNSSLRDNHYAAGATAVMQVGVITNNKEFIEWGRKGFLNQTDQINSNGTLPYEITRGQMALHYHNTECQWLLYMAELSRMIGEDWWTNDKLQKLMDFTYESNLDHSKIEKITGVATYNDQFPTWGWVGLLSPDDPRRVKMISENRSGIPSSSWLGGDLEPFRKMVERNRK